jgi:Ca2+/Na+ antiporter
MFYRDSIVYLLTLAILAFFLRDNIIDIFEALILCCLWPCYFYFANTFSVVSEINKEIEDEESNKLIEEGKLFKQSEIHTDKK